MATPKSLNSCYQVHLKLLAYLQKLPDYSKASRETQELNHMNS